MKRLRAGLYRWLLTAALFSAAAGLSRAEVVLPAQIAVGDVTLSRLEQHTVRYAGLMRVYTLALYVQTGQPLSGSHPGSTQCLVALYHRALKREVLAEAATRILLRQHPPEVMETYQPMLDRLHDAYVDIRPGDRYRLCHIAGKGLSLSHNNGVPFTLANEDFARFYLGIWLGPEGILDEV